MRLIINADDFGYSPEINSAVCRAFQEAGVNSTSTLVNFEPGFVDARRILDAGLLPREQVGIHFNLTEGVPLTKPILTHARFCAAGAFHGKLRRSPSVRLSSAEEAALKQELEAQLARFMSLGFAPAHADSHHHVHNEWALLGSFISTLKEYGIPHLRVSRNVGKITAPKMLYKKLLNYRLARGNTVRAKYFGDLNDIGSMRSMKLPLEVMVHPALLNGQLVDSDGRCLVQKINTALLGRFGQALR